MAEGVSSVPSPADVAAQVAERSFTQAEVNEIVQSRLKNMKADYEQLHAKVAAAGFGVVVDAVADFADAGCFGIRHWQRRS